MNGRGLPMALATLLASACLVAPAAAGDLSQRIDADQDLSGGRVVLDRGHVDIGPRFVDGSWRIMIHDDSGRGRVGGASVWRHPERTVFRIGDEAVQAVPDDPGYGFLGVEPGAEVHVVPQTQHPRVVWIGWNTQDPEVMARIDRGVRMSLVGIDGPGRLTVYLQSGSFDDPEVLWDSDEPGRKPVWVDANTHTHANWVFTRPGAYLVRMRVEADLADGSEVSDTRDLRISVGKDTDPRSALVASWGGTEPAATAEPSRSSEGGPGTVVALVIAVAGFASFVVLAAVLSARAKRRARGRSDGRSVGDGR